MRGSQPGERRGGRQKGTPNKTTKALREMLLEAVDQVGGTEYFIRQAERNPVAFMALVARLLPRDAKVDLNVTQDTADRDRFITLLCRMTESRIEKQLSGEDLLVIEGDLTPVPADPDRWIEN